MAVRTTPLGRLTRWRLPQRDARIEALGDEERRAIARVWFARIDTEARAIAGFTLLSEGLAARAADPMALALARRAIDDERRHAELCRRVASVYLGQEVPERPPPSFTPPPLPGADDAIRPTLLAVALCCLQETTSSAYIEACRDGATAPLARAALRELLADEIDHARVGWAQLASPRLDEARRHTIADWLVPLARANLAAWTRPTHEDGTHAAALLAHGCGSRGISDRIGLDATRELIAPGFARCGFVLPPTESWMTAVPAAAMHNVALLPGSS